MILSLEKIVFAKRTAMNTGFWCACALDDDNGFDRLMRMQSKDQLNSAEWGGVFLHAHLKDFEVSQIQRFVRDTAIKLLCNLVGVTADVAITALERTRTSDQRNADGTYTLCGYNGVSFE